MSRKIIISCIAWVVICLVISSLSGWITSANVTEWYAHIQKPSFNPPSWIFGPVWTVLYIMIGLSGGLLWLKRSAHPLAFGFYIVQLMFNFAWSFIFFGGHYIGWALFDIILLWLSIAITVVLSYKASRAASLLLVPYLAWVSFAFVLNLFLWKLN